MMWGMDLFNFWYRESQRRCVAMDGRLVTAVGSYRSGGNTPLDEGSCVLFLRHGSTIYGGCHVWCLSRIVWMSQSGALYFHYFQWCVVVGCTRLMFYFLCSCEDFVFRVTLSRIHFVVDNSRSSLFPHTYIFFVLLSFSCIGPTSRGSNEII